MDARVHDKYDLDQLCGQVRVADVFIVTHHHYQHVDDLGHTGVIQHVRAEPGNSNNSLVYFSLILVNICYKISFENQLSKKVKENIFDFVHVYAALD